MEGLIGLGIGVVLICIIGALMLALQKRKFKRQRQAALDQLNMNFRAIDKKHNRISHRANLVNNKDNS